MLLGIVMRVNVERVLLKDSARYKKQVANIWQDMRHRKTNHGGILHRPSGTADGANVKVVCAQGLSPRAPITPALNQARRDHARGQHQCRLFLACQAR
jgi:hypothetical protein